MTIKCSRLWSDQGLWQWIPPLPVFPCPPCWLGDKTTCCTHPLSSSGMFNGVDFQHLSNEQTINIIFGPDSFSNNSRETWINKLSHIIPEWLFDHFCITRTSVRQQACFISSPFRTNKVLTLHLDTKSEHGGSVTAPSLSPCTLWCIMTAYLLSLD